MNVSASLMYRLSGSANFKALRFGPGCRAGGKFGTVVSVSAARLHCMSSQRCDQRLGVVCDADVPSADSVLGQSVIRSWRAILGQVIPSVG